jgi:hypothetical protein
MAVARPKDLPMLSLCGLIVLVGPLGRTSPAVQAAVRAFTSKSIFKILAVATAILLPLPAGAQTTAQFALSERELGQWLSAMQRIGAANLADAAPSDPVAQTDSATLDDICSQAGFESAKSCSCTVFYVALLLNGFDSEKKIFVDPAQAVEDRLAKSGQTESAGSAGVARDRRMLLALREALPHGAPPEHLALLGEFLRTRVGAEAEPWRELGAGAKSMAARALGARCKRSEGNASERK